MAVRLSKSCSITFLALAALLLSAPSEAQWSFSSCGIVTVGMKGGVIDPYPGTTAIPGWFTITGIGGGTGNGLGGPVTLDFNQVLRPSGSPDIRLCSVVTDVGMTANIVCSGPVGKIIGTSNSSGVFKVRIAAGGVVPLACGYSNPPCSSGSVVQMYDGNTLIGTVNVAIPDEDGSGGVGASDLSILVGDSFPSCGPFSKRSDLDFTGVVGPADIGKWLGIYFAGNSVSSCSPYPCP